MYPKITPATRLVAVTPHNDTVYSPPLRSLYVGTGGNLAVLAADDTVSQILSNVPAGTELSVAVKKVLATGTTASTILGYR